MAELFSLPKITYDTESITGVGTPCTTKYFENYMDYVFSMSGEYRYPTKHQKRHKIDEELGIINHQPLSFDFSSEEKMVEFLLRFS